jgi:hypothetical protein
VYVDLTQPDRNASIALASAEKQDRRCDLGQMRHSPRRSRGLSGDVRASFGLSGSLPVDRPGVRPISRSRAQKQQRPRWRLAWPITSGPLTEIAGLLD